jgi:hypothetical protein
MARNYVYLKRFGATMEAYAIWGRKVQNWEDKSFAQRMKGRIFHMIEDSDLVFTSVITMAANAGKWDSMRKYLGNQPRIRVADPRRGESPTFHILITKPPPTKHGKLVFTSERFNTKEDVFSFLREHLVADSKSDIVEGIRPFNKYTTNVEHLKLFQNRRESDPPSPYQVSGGSPQEFAKYAEARGAEVQVSDDGSSMVAEFPPDVDQFKMQYTVPWPSGNEDDDESEVFND